MSAPLREPVDLSLDPGLAEEARSLGVDLSRATEAGLREAVRAAKAKAWLEENAEALQSYNEWVERHGLPLEKHRQL